MRKVLSLFMFLLLCAGMLAGCANTSGSGDGEGTTLPDASETIADGYFRINYKSSAANLRVWVWDDVATSCADAGRSWPDGFALDHKNGDFVCTDLELADNPQKVSMIVINSSGTKLTGSADISFLFPQKYNEVFFNAGSNVVYINRELTKQAMGLQSAEITGENTITIAYNDVTPSTDNVKVYDRNGNEAAVSSVSDTSITTSASLKDTYAAKGPFTVKMTDTNGDVDTRTASLDGSLVDTWFDASSVSDLGWNGTDTVKLWAPLASSAVLNVYAEAADANPAQTFDMTRGEYGVWSWSGLSAYREYYYNFTVTNNGVSHYVLDPYAKTMAAFDSDTDGSAGRGFLFDSSKMGSVTNGYVSLAQREDAVIYEVSVRDFTISDDSGVDSTKRGTYEGFIDKLDYLKSLGVTHIELLPVLNWYYGNESDRSYESSGTASGNNYNWGYDPHNYFTPEGWYSSAASDPYARVTELKDLINACHEKGMGVILDVVYNHLAKTFLLDEIVPDYYFRESDGSLTNQSGCGNDTATEKKMMAKLMEDSVEYWTKEYKVDGYRFDIMGLLDADAVEAAYVKASALNPDTLFIGEGWQYGVSGAMDQTYMTSTDDCAVFNDNIRDLTKAGGMSDAGTGFITGSSTINSTRFFNNLIGLPSKSRSDTYTADDPGDNVQFLVCHDGLTLHDTISYNVGLTDAANETELVKRIKMGNFVTLTSQGIAFLHGGQERGRTKPRLNATTGAAGSGECLGNYVRNSYDSSDNINQIVWTLDAAYQGLHDYTAGLIALRRATDAFRLGSESAVESNISQITTASGQQMAYKINDTANNCTWIVVMNGATTSAAVDTGISGTYSVYADADTAGTTAISTPSGVSANGSTVTLDGLTCAVLKVNN
ncbi:MAG TPA: alpha-amylase [Treponema sp.]|nr:alpha-amylase [Treponema sp.]